VKVVDQFTRDEIRRADERYGLAAGDVVYLRDASGAGRSTAERLAATEPRVVLRAGNLSDAADEVLFDAGIPVAPAADVTMQEVDELAVARESEVEAAIEDWERRAAERRRARKAEMVDEIISEHRAESRSG
jgi:predicted RNase H-like nuclease (RuvC/YqgF family)